MSKRSPPLWYSVISLGFAAAGVSKLVGVGAQRHLFESWGWSEEAMRAVGGLELAGAAMVASRATRRIGGLTLAATSAVILAAESRHHDDALLPARFGMLLGALTAIL